VKPSISLIIADVAEYYHLSPDELIAPGHARREARPRQIAMWLCRRLATVNGVPPSYPEIGRTFGGRDHTTAVHAVQTVQARIDALDAGTIEHICELRGIIEKHVAKQEALFRARLPLLIADAKRREEYLRAKRRELMTEAGEVSPT